MKHKKPYNSQVEIRTISAEKWLSSASCFPTSLFHQPEWLDSLIDDMKKPVYVEFLLGPKTIGILSALICKGNWLQGTYLFAYSGLVTQSEYSNYYDDCHCALYSFSKKNGWTRIIIGSYDQQHTLICSAPNFFTTKRMEYIVTFQHQGNEHSFSTGFKKNFKKAAKLGTIFQQGRQVNVLDRLFELLESTHFSREKKYHTSYNPLYLRHMTKDSLLKLLNSGLARIYFTLNDHAIHSVQLNLEKNNKAYGLLMGSDDFAYQNGLPSLIDSELIHSFKQNGFQYYNTGGTPKTQGSKGLEQYKRFMGATPIEFYGCTTNYITFPHNLLNPLLNTGRKLAHHNLFFFEKIKSILYR